MNVRFDKYRVLAGSLTRLLGSGHINGSSGTQAHVSAYAKRRSQPLLSLLVKLPEVRLVRRKSCSSANPRGWRPMVRARTVRKRLTWNITPDGLKILV